ncbi:MAG: asparagine synthase-related protein, partial [Ginsengibacter sp.]
NTKKVYLARDRAGKKPLYIWQKDSGIVFSSELKVLNQVINPGINKSAINEYLYLGYCFKTHTAYKNVRELENGTYLQIDAENNEYKIERWFDIEKFYERKVSLTHNEALSALDEKLNKAVQCRLESSDVPVGAFLSGGIDSGLITAIASKYKNNLSTFTIRLPGDYDESALAFQVAQKYNTTHAAIDISFDNLQQDFEMIVGNYGEPFRESSAIPTYYVSKAAKEYITVVLNGDGADELFGGYRRYVPFRHFDFFSSSEIMQLFFTKFSSIVTIAHEKKSMYNYIYRLMKFAGYKDLVKMYSSVTNDLFVGYESAFKQMPRLNSIRNMLNRLKTLNASSLQKLLIADFNNLFFSSLLPKMDIGTMAHSLEGRSPFLSKDILEFAPSIHDKYKINGFTTKYLLRLLAKKYLPQQLIHQPKRGFEVPLKKWIDNDLNNILQDYLFSSNTLYSDFINEKFVTDLYKKRINISDEKRAKMLYCILCLEIWYKQLKEQPAFHQFV